MCHRESASSCLISDKLSKLVFCGHFFNIHILKCIDFDLSDPKRCFLTKSIYRESWSIYEFVLLSFLNAESPVLEVSVSKNHYNLESRP